MKREVTVLLSSAGRRVGLLSCLRASGAKLGVSVRVLAADMRPELSAACWRADGSFRVPPCSSPEHGEAVLELCRREAIQLVVPTIDTELLALTHAREALEAAGAWVSVSDEATVALGRDKGAAAELLRERGVAVPRTASVQAVLAEPDAWEWPVFVKPATGSSSIGAGVATSPFDLKLQALKTAGLIVQEMCRGVEYTVNLYFDRETRLRAVVPHERIEVRAGEVSKARTCLDQQLVAVGRAFASVFPPMRGAICIQVFHDTGASASRPILTDINLRFGGGYPLAHAAGAEFTTWLLQERLGLEPEWNPPLKDGLAMLRYDDAVFVEAR